jgi:hypothetical protein
MQTAAITSITSCSVTFALTLRTTMSQNVELQVCLSFHDERICRVIAPHTPTATHDLARAKVAHHLQAVLLQLDKDRHSKLDQNFRSVQHDLLLCIADSASSAQQLLSSLVSLLLKRSNITTEDILGLGQAPVADTQDLVLLLNISTALRATLTDRHLKIAHAILQQLFSSTAYDGDSSGSASGVVAPLHMFVRILALMGALQIELRWLEFPRRDSNIAAIVLSVNQHITTLGQLLSSADGWTGIKPSSSAAAATTTTTTTTITTRDRTLWAVFLQHEMLLLELLRVKSLMLTTNNSNDSSSSPVEKLADLDVAVMVTTELFKRTLGLIHEQSVTVHLGQELDCLIVNHIVDLISDWRPSPGRQAQHQEVVIKFTGNRFIMKFTLLKVRVLVAKQHFAEAQSMLKSVLNNPGNSERDQAAILHNMTIFRPWNGPHSLAELTFQRSLQLQIDTERLFGKVQYPAVDIAATIYNLALTMMKASRFCEAYHLFAFVPVLDELRFGCSPLCFLRIGESCIQHDRVMRKHSTHPIYRVQSASCSRFRYHALV